MIRKRALITGVCGQDGSFLTELLSCNNYEVHGIEKMPLNINCKKTLDNMTSAGIRLDMHACDLCDYNAVSKIIKDVNPDEIYHLAAIHSSSSANANVNVREDRSIFDCNILYASNLIHAVKENDRHARLVLAGSCFMFDSCEKSPQLETTSIATNSLYGLSKATMFKLASLIRFNNNLHISTAILYNHESPRRHPSFVTQKIAQSVAAIKRGEIDNFILGNLNVIKDWGYAKDYVYGMWLMAQRDRPSDYILATGEPHSVKHFVELAFDIAGIDNWRKYVKVDNGCAITSHANLIGDPTKAYNELNWRRTVSFRELVAMMVEAALSNNMFEVFGNLS